MRPVRTLADVEGGEHVVMHVGDIHAGHEVKVEQHHQEGDDPEGDIIVHGLYKEWRWTTTRG